MNGPYTCIHSSSSQNLVSKIPYLAESIVQRRCHGHIIESVQCKTEKNTHKSDDGGVSHRRSSCRIKTKMAAKKLRSTQFIIAVNNNYLISAYPSSREAKPNSFFYLNGNIGSPPSQQQQRRWWLWRWYWWCLALLSIHDWHNKIKSEKWTKIKVLTKIERTRERESERER